MATTETTPGNLQVASTDAPTASGTPEASTTGDWTKERVTVRSYWKWIIKKVKNKKTGVVTEKQVAKFIAKTESDGQKNWKEVEAKKDKDGNPEWTFFAENSFDRHTIKTMEAFYALVQNTDPDGFDQQAYVANAGIGYVQNSKMNALAVEEQDGTGVNGIPPVPVHNQKDIDLASYINEKPGRRVKTIEEKVKEMLIKSGMDVSRAASFLAGMQAKYAAAAASGVALQGSEEEESEEEEEEEEGAEETPAN